MWNRRGGDRHLDSPPGKRHVLQAGKEVRTVLCTATKYQSIRDGLPSRLINPEYDKMDCKTLKIRMTSFFC